MLMIPGANGDADAFGAVADHLAAHHTVVTYDRRGFSRSRLDGPQDYDRRLETDADDARRLIEHLSDDPATVFGSSSGGLVALELLARHPSTVHTLVPYEPPAVKLLPDGQRWADFFTELYGLYRRSGVQPALERFREEAFAEPDRQAMAALRAKDPKKGKYLLANATYWFEHELRQYPAVELDVDVLTAHADRVVLAAGRESHGYPAHDATVALGPRIGRDVIEMPGGHLGHVTHPGRFADALVSALRLGGHVPKA
ncbi:alpha/beta fold hydrolase [Streptomyces iakyrus]|uniref:alpha/beta fold hydrolase n=1 Tax=Streptomyces iakyrus TaxID=68219 RepID=UPI00068C7CE5|nr:alpha/beta fold hydrolase [Streptomyces iakyrus]